jgi:putative transposase
VTALANSQLNTHDRLSGTHRVGTVRHELLDRMLIIGRRHLETVLADYVAHYNQHRPHRSLHQAPPLGAAPQPAPASDVRVVRLDRLGGLIHEYALVA